MSTLDEVRLECERVRSLMAKCEGYPEKAIALHTMRVILKRSEEAVTKYDVSELVWCLNRLRGIK